MNNGLSFPVPKSGNERRGYWRASAAYWICQIIGWSFYLFLSSYAWLTGIVPLTVYEVIAALSVVGSGILATHLLRSVILRQDWQSLPSWKLLGRAFVAAVLAGAFIQGIGEILVLIGVQLGLAAAHPAPSDRATWATLLIGIGAGTFMVAIWQALYFQIQMMRRHRRAEAERWKLEAALANAELGALKAQLNPHFLFNCLNGLRALVVEDHGRAQNVITRLANVLRYSLQSSANPTVSLGQEFQTVDDYLDLEAIRFEERLRVRREIDPDTLHAQVPPMVVQTLVENAIKYGVAKQPGAGEIEISSRRMNGEVVVAITNTGQIEAQAGSTGLGLRNAGDRLRRLLGPSASITLAQSPNDLVTATIRIPLGIHPSVERDSVELGGDVGLATARRPDSTESRSTRISSP